MVKPSEVLSLVDNPNNPLVTPPLVTNNNPNNPRYYIGINLNMFKSTTSYMIITLVTLMYNPGSPVNLYIYIYIYHIVGVRVAEK